MRKPLLAASVFTAILTISCSKNGPEVPLEVTGASLEGTVSYGDKRVANAMIIVAQIGAGGGGTQAFADDEGNYKVENVPMGQVKIGVNTEAAKGMMRGRGMAGTNPLEKGGKKSTLPKVTDIPKQYFDPLSSGLTASVDNKGVNHHDIIIPNK